MRHPIEMCLATGEWVEDRRATVSASWMRKEPETKTIWTFLSQGAAGGALGYFAMAAVLAIASATDAPLVYCVFLPMFLISGAMLGTIAAILIWLVGLLLKRRLNWVARALVVTGVLVALSLALTQLTKDSPTERARLWAMVGYLCIIKLPIVLLTGSRIRPCRLMFLGAGPRGSRHNLGSWLAYPAGFLLRSASVFGLLEALMALAIWIASPTTGLPGKSALLRLLATVLAVFYFAASSYFSFRTPRKGFLLPTVFLLNVPLAALVIYLEQLDTFETMFLSDALQALVCLWAVYTLGRLIAPETPARLLAAKSVRNVAGSWPEEAAVLKLSTPSACQV